MPDADGSSTAAQIAKVFFDSTLAFYDKAPVIASIGYLLVVSSLPLYLILRFAAKMKKLDNDKVIALYNKEILGVKNPKVSDESTGVSPAAPPQA